jgi:hypothetical protein
MTSACLDMEKISVTMASVLQRCGGRRLGPLRWVFLVHTYSVCTEPELFDALNLGVARSASCMTKLKYTSVGSFPFTAKGRVGSGISTLGTAADELSASAR